jgi:hypothetical protein
MTSVARAIERDETAGLMTTSGIACVVAPRSYFPKNYSKAVAAATALHQGASRVVIHSTYRGSVSAGVRLVDGACGTNCGPTFAHAQAYAHRRFPAGPEGRKILAHGVSRGSNAQNIASPGRGERFSWRGLRGAREPGIFALRAARARGNLSPLRGLSRERYLHPRLTPWATLCRRSAAERHRKDFSLTPMGRMRRPCQV